MNYVVLNIWGKHAMRKSNEKIDQDVEGEGENVENEEWEDVEEKE